MAHFYGKGGTDWTWALVVLFLVIIVLLVLYIGLVQSNYFSLSNFEFPR